MEEVDPVQDSVSSISNEDNVSLSEDIAHFTAGKLQNSFKISTKHIFLQISNRVQNLGTSAPPGTHCSMECWKVTIMII